jgi:hypothetical protein
MFVSCSPCWIWDLKLCLAYTQLTVCWSATCSLGCLLQKDEEKKNRHCMSEIAESKIVDEKAQNKIRGDKHKTGIRIWYYTDWSPFRCVDNNRVQCE